MSHRGRGLGVSKGDLRESVRKVLNSSGGIVDDDLADQTVGRYGEERDRQTDKERTSKILILSNT